MKTAIQVIACALMGWGFVVATIAFHHLTK